MRSDTAMPVKGQTFTVDHVFGSEMSQSGLYEKTAGPMLKSFLDGYNVTIMAYGQTGSGKSYTMGTGDAPIDDTETQGLIPRFISDLFDNINHNQLEGKEDMQCKVSVAFLEIYGEDVFDLLVDSPSGYKSISERPSLAVRENDQGHVFVQGQNDVTVVDAAEALDLL